MKALRQSVVKFCDLIGYESEKDVKVSILNENDGVLFEETISVKELGNKYSMGYGVVSSPKFVDEKIEVEIKYFKTLSSDVITELRAIASPLRAWLLDNYNMMSQIVIDCDHVEVVSKECGIPFLDNDKVLQ